MSMHARNDKNQFLWTHRCKERRFQDCSPPCRLKTHRDLLSEWVYTLDISFCKWTVVYTTQIININMFIQS